MVARCDLVEQNQVGAEHDCVAVVEAEDVLDLLAVAAGDALQVAGVVLRQPAADATALPADQVHQRVVAEITLHADHAARQQRRAARSEEHTSELQSLMRISYAVFCLKKKNHNKQTHTKHDYYTRHTHT